MYNKIIIAGRLGQDPELKYTSSNTAVTNLNVATTERWQSNGEKQERTDWHRVSVFGNQAEACANYTGKGDLVLVEGSQRYNKWEDNEGNNRVTPDIRATNVKFLSTKGNNNQSGGGGGSAPSDEDAPF